MADCIRDNDVSQCAQGIGKLLIAGIAIGSDSEEALPGESAAAEEGSQAAILRGAVEQQYQDVVGSQSIRVRGPVLSGAMDTRTGDIFFGQNTGIPEPLAPELRSALEDFDGPGAAGKGIPGAHSEINAVNQGLLANPDSQISDYIFYSLRLRGALQGEPIEMCPNCAGILGQ
jgi:hypothetical protein